MNKFYQKELENHFNSKIKKLHDDNYIVYKPLIPISFAVSKLIFGKVALSAPASGRYRSFPIKFKKFYFFDDKV
jgi:hypothetical protein